MSKTIKVALAGAGAFGVKHLDAIKLIDGVEVVSLISRDLDKTKETAAKHGIGHVTTNLADSLALKEVDAVILCTPTQMHAEQSIACMKAGKHVQVEIPLADTLAGAEAVAALAKQSGLVAMCGHTRRFNPSHQYVHNKIKAGEFNIQQMDVQTYFFRRTNMNALGQARSWTDHLLWHHAAHTVDLFAYQTGGDIVKANAVQGPIHPALGISTKVKLKPSAFALQFRWPKRLLAPHRLIFMTSTRILLHCANQSPLCALVVMRISSGCWPLVTSISLWTQACKSMT